MNRRVQGCKVLAGSEPDWHQAEPRLGKREGVERINRFAQGSGNGASSQRPEKQRRARSARNFSEERARLRLADCVAQGVGSGRAGAARAVFADLTSQVPLDGCPKFETASRNVVGFGGVLNRRT